MSNSTRVLFYEVLIIVLEKVGKFTLWKTFHQAVSIIITKCSISVCCNHSLVGAYFLVLSKMKRNKFGRRDALLFEYGKIKEEEEEEI